MSEETGFAPSGVATDLAKDVYAKLVDPSSVLDDSAAEAANVRVIAEAIDIARAEEHKESGKAAVRAITRAQLEVIDQCVTLVRKANKMGIVTPGTGPRSKINEALKMMEAESARLRGIEDYQSQGPESSPIIAPPAAALPKGRLT